MKDPIMIDEWLNKKLYIDINIGKLFYGNDVNEIGCYILTSKDELHDIIDAYVKEKLDTKQKQEIIKYVLEPERWYKNVIEGFDETSKNDDVLCYGIIYFYCIYNYLFIVDENYDDHHALIYGYNQANQARLDERYSLYNKLKEIVSQ